MAIAQPSDVTTFHIYLLAGDHCMLRSTPSEAFRDTSSGRETIVADIHATLATFHAAATSAAAVAPILVVQGSDGSGKSTLLRQTHQHAVLAFGAAQVISLDWQRYQPVSLLDVADALAAAISAQHPAFDQGYQVAKNRRAACARQLGELRLEWQRWQRCSSDERTEPLVSLLLIDDPPLWHGDIAQPFVTALVEHLRDTMPSIEAYMDDHGAPPTSFDDLATYALGDELAVLHNETLVVNQLVEDLRVLTSHMPLVLVMDSYDGLERYDIWLREVVLRSNPRIATVIAGSSHLLETYRHTFGDRPVYACNLDETPLEPRDIQSYLAALSGAAPPDALVQALATWSQGVPLVLGALVSQITTYGDVQPVSFDVDLADTSLAAVVASSFVGTVLDDSQGPAQHAQQKHDDRAMLRSLALMFHPDNELVAAMWGMSVEETVQAARALVARYPFLFHQAPFELHPAAKRQLRTEMLAAHASDPDWALMTLGLQQCTELLLGRLEQITNAEPDPVARVALPEWRTAVFDCLHFLLWTRDHETARQHLLSRWLEAYYAHSPLASALVAVASEQAPPGEAWDMLLRLMNDQAPYKHMARLAQLLDPAALAVLCCLGAGLHNDADAMVMPIDTRIGFLHRAHAAAPTWAVIRDELAETYVERGIVAVLLHQTHVPALADFRRAQALQGGDTRALLLAGAACAAAMEFEEADSYLTAVLEREPMLEWALHLRGVVRDALGDVDGALADFDQALEANPEAVAVWVSRAALRVQQHEDAPALADFDAAITLIGDDAYLYHQRALLHEMTGNIEGALADYSAALAIDPDAVPLLLGRAGLLAQQNQIAGAMRDLDQVLVIEPESAGVLHQRGVLHAMTGNLVAAIRDFNAALALQPDLAAVLSDRGAARYELGDHNGALADLNASLQVLPHVAETLQLRAVVKNTLGDLQGALLDYNAALAAMSSDPRSQQPAA